MFFGFGDGRVDFKSAVVGADMFEIGKGGDVIEPAALGALDGAAGFVVVEDERVAAMTGEFDHAPGVKTPIQYTPTESGRSEGGSDNLRLGRFRSCLLVY